MAQGRHSLTLQLKCLAQRRVEQLVLEGKNVFFTGNAGTGTWSCMPPCPFHLRRQGKQPLSRWFRRSTGSRCRRSSAQASRSC